MENENPTLINPIEKEFELVFRESKLVNVQKESVFQLIRNIKDPEHPYTLKQLNVVALEDVFVSESEDETVMCSSGQPVKTIDVVFTPTVPHCSMAGIIGLCIYYQLSQCIDGHLIRVSIKKDTHSTDAALNKQLSDKDRIAAAFQNEGLLDMINECINGQSV